MKTKTINVYSFKELSDAAKDRARIDYETNWGGANWDRDGEYMAALKALAEHFGARLSDWSIDWSGGAAPSSVEFEAPTQEDSGLSKTAWEKHLREKLQALGSYNRRTLKGNGDCKLTGMCYDENAIDGFRWAFYREGERDLNALLQAAYDSWIKAAHEDYAYDFGNEGLAENFDANGYEFDEEGARIKS